MNIVLKVQTVVENGDFKKVISVQSRIDKKQIMGSDADAMAAYDLVQIQSFSLTSASDYNIQF